MEQNISSIAKAFYDERKQHSSLSKSAKDSIDSFLCFASFVTNDTLYYPFWANIVFENCDRFISEFVYSNYEISQCHGKTLEVQARELILKNRDFVWNFFKKFPAVKIKSNLDKKNNIVLNYIFRTIIEIASRKKKNFQEYHHMLFRLAACDEFFQYSNKILSDITASSSKDYIFCSIDAFEFAEKFRYDRKEIFFKKLKNILNPYR